MGDQVTDGDSAMNLAGTAHDMDVTKVPGTQLLVDVQQELDAKHASGTSDIVLVPTPSADPDDPLNWALSRKLLATFCWVLYTLMNGIAGSNLYSVIVPFSEASGITVSTINAGTGYLFLLAGWGLLFWQPLALQYGKRPVYIASLLGLIAMTMWSPYISSNGQWYARSVLLGFFASPIEALPELSVADLYFAHERGRYIGLYALTLVGSNFFAPIIFGFVNDGQSWQWVFYYTAIFCGAAAVFLFLFLEETNYNRAEPGQSSEKNPEAAAAAASTTTTTTTTAHRKTYLQKLSLKDKPRPFMMLYRVKRQLLFLTWPVVIYSGFAYGSTLIWFNVLNATASVILSAPPYGFRSTIVGLSYVAPLLGVCVGFVCVGRLSDALVVRLARRNRGVMEPETRLWIFAASTLLIPVGLIVWGVGSAHDVHWIGLLFAMAMLGFSNTCGASLSVNYLVDCYRELAGDALTALIIIRNTMSFAINYGITPWLENLGTQNCFISAAFVGLAASLSFLIMIMWGKGLRERKRERYWELVQEARAKGLVH